MLDWITGLIGEAGAPGVAFLMFLENLYPPIPSELVMPLAGFAAAQGEVSLAAIVLAGTLGSLAGAWAWYLLGRRIGMERLEGFARRHGRWLTLTPGDLRAADAWFDTHGGRAVLLGRMVPGVRTLISVPAGISGMPPGRFLLFSAIGTFAWTLALALAGYVLERNWESVGDWIDPVSLAVAAGLLLWYLYRVATFETRLRAERDRQRG